MSITECAEDQELVSSGHQQPHI